MGNTLGEQGPSAGAEDLWGLWECLSVTSIFAALSAPAFCGMGTAFPGFSEIIVRSARLFFIRSPRLYSRWPQKILSGHTQPLYHNQPLGGVQLYMTTLSAPCTAFSVIPQDLSSLQRKRDRKKNSLVTWRHNIFLRPNCFLQAFFFFLKKYPFTSKESCGFKMWTCPNFPRKTGHA